MHLFIKLVVWLALTVGLQLICIALYGVYESGFGPYQCGFLDAGHHCGIVEYAFNKLFIANLAVGIPTIIAGIIAMVVVRRAMKDTHI